MNNGMKLCLAMLISVSINAQTIDLQGVVSNKAGQPITGAVVSLVRQGMKDTTGTDGKYLFSKGVAVQLPAILPSTEMISVNNGILEFTLRNPAPMAVEIFNVKGALLQKELFRNIIAGAYRLDIGKIARQSNLLVIKASIGNRSISFRYLPIGNGGHVLKPLGEYAVPIASGLAQMAAVVDTIKVTASGFSAKAITITSYENQQQNITLDSANGSTGSIGCGKELSAVKSGTYTITSANLSRQYIISIPTNYDKNKPYRLIFGMHCFGSNMQGVANDKYYQLKRYADSTKENCIFVAPNGVVTNGNAMWDQAEKDHTFFDDMLKLFKENLCIDTARVFSCGFSYGAMFTNSLSRNHKNVLRAVACYAPANWNIYVPPMDTTRHIAYMSTTGIDDPSCKWIYDDAKKQGGKYCVLDQAEGNDCNLPASIPMAKAGSKSHLCYEFEGCEAGYPVKVCTFDGAHQAGPMDGQSGDNSSKSWIPGETWKFFMQF
jgi:poly(3-hydroxybutyrate) depolymerase